MRRAAALTAAMVVMFAGVTLVTPLLPEYQQRWDLAVSVSTLLFAAYVVGVVAALLVLGRLADAVGSGPVLLAAFVLGDLAALLALLAPDAGWLLVARVLHGIGVGLVPGATAAALTRAGVRSATASVLLSAATTTGIAAGLLLGGTLAGTGATSAWLVYGAALALGTLHAASGVARGDRATGLRRWAVQRPVTPGSVGRRSFATALLGTAVAFASIALFAGLGPVLTAGGAGGSALTGALIAATAYLVSGATQLTVARHLDDARPGAFVLTAGLVVLVAGVRADSPALLLLAAVAIGIGNGLVFPPTLHTAQRLASDDQRAGVVSTYYLAMYGGIALPIVALGVLADVTSLVTATQTTALVVAAAALVAAARPALAGPPHHQEDHACPTD